MKIDKTEIGKEIVSWVKTIILALLLAAGINTFIIVNAEVPSGSMENTIMTNDRIVAFRLSYLFGEPDRGDVIVFHFPDDPTGKTLYVKRIIGLPGEKLEIKKGRVYINGNRQPLAEPYLKEKAIGDFGPYEVPEGCYFMMGDNRNDSQDARFWQNTYVEKSEILGKVIFRYYKGFKLIE
ncbi:signal peptidase I [Clostridium sp. MD294]|uniref:signal peptidase I n=1 Tax=Clostridium sp. MD294 TaxID=97138 RepID=UPI0002CC4C40|nr:signal peptidase I [Clostridium sp. MD294]NDO47248.1 signal peptidase I [Clostridium sp. MD294]USF29685.1 Signal peptidase I S [Clostridium sp. MD294]